MKERQIVMSIDFDALRAVVLANRDQHTPAEDPAATLRHMTARRLALEFLDDPGELGRTAKTVCTITGDIDRSSEERFVKLASEESCARSRQRVARKLGCSDWGELRDAVGLQQSEHVLLALKDDLQTFVAARTALDRTGWLGSRYHFTPPPLIFGRVQHLNEEIKHLIREHIKFLETLVASFAVEPHLEDASDDSDIEYDDPQCNASPGA